jgi:maleate cis-trans isomerase
MSKIGMTTPYNRDVTEREIEFLKTNKVRVMDYQYWDIVENLDRGALHPERVFSYAKRLNTANADGIFISCANIRSIEIISRLKKISRNLHFFQSARHGSLFERWDYHENQRLRKFA